MNSVYSLYIYFSYYVFENDLLFDFLTVLLLYVKKRFISFNY